MSRQPIANLLFVLALSAGLAGCAHRLPAAERVPSFAVAATDDTPLARIASRELAGSPADHSALHLLRGGKEALAARLALIERAQRSVDVQYYIWRADASGQLMATALRRAAERGVRVRLLLDDWGSRPTEAELGLLAAHPNVEVRLFNPLPLRWALTLGMLLDFERGNRRMHNKALVADNQAAIVGGRNVGDEYFESRREFVFSDVDALALGPVVRQVSKGFDAYWNSVDAVPVAPGDATAPAPERQIDEALHESVASTGFAQRLDGGTLPFQAGRALALYDFPEKVDPTASRDARPGLGRQIAAVVAEPGSELLLVSAYFVPGAGGVEQLRGFRSRGVRVVAVTNSLAATDVPAVHGGYARYRKPLLEGGVELYEIRADAQETAARNPRRPGSSRVSLHAKLMVIDRRVTFIGSMNIDPRSVALNTENGIVFESAEMGEAIASGIRRALGESAYRLEIDGGALRWRGGADGREVLESEPGASLWLRLKTRFMSWLAIEELL